MGIQCAFCHSTVDNSFAPGIGKRLDGWANRDLNVGAIVSLAPNLKPFTDLLGVDVETVKKVLASWGPGRYDAELDKDGKAFRPDGKQAGTLIPPAFGLAGVNLATWTGFGSVTYWNAYVGGDPDARRCDVLRCAVQQQGSVSCRRTEWLGKHPEYAGQDHSQAGRAALLPALDPGAEGTGRVIRQGCIRTREDGLQRSGKCATCHVPPLYTEPGYNMHTPAEIGIDSFQADRSPTHMYRTAPLAGLWTHQKGGFFHDGRFATLLDVVNHYDTQFNLNLSDANKKDLVEYLKGI